MRGPKPKYPVELTTEEEKELRQLVRSHKTPQAKAKRARILLAAFDHPDWTNQQIAREAGTVDRVVRRWRRRWSETRSIEDLPRPGRPRVFPPCGESASHGIGLQPPSRGGGAADEVEQLGDCAEVDSPGRGAADRS